MRNGPRPSTQTCFSCAYFEYCDPDDIDGSDGYCGHPGHRDEATSPHYEYGGHWTSNDSWCQWWSAADAAAMIERRSQRAIALRKAADAIDPAEGRVTE